MKKRLYFVYQLGCWAERQYVRWIAWGYINKCATLKSVPVGLEKFFTLHTCQYRIRDYKSTGKIKKIMLISDNEMHHWISLEHVKVIEKCKSPVVK